MDYMDPDVHCAKKAVKFNYSLTHLLWKLTLDIMRLSNV